jgi:two-component system, response regulator PdtaR
VVIAVEDDPLLVILAEDIVDSAGFEACFARRADDAIRILEQRYNVRVVLTDVDMPGAINGVDLALAVHRPLGTLPSGVRDRGKT